MRLLNIISCVCARFGSVTEEPFGRLDVILVGYSHQFLPVAGKSSLIGKLAHSLGEMGELWGAVQCCTAPHSRAVLLIGSTFILALQSRQRQQAQSIFYG